MSGLDLRELAVALLLGFSALVCVVSSLALLVMKGFYDKLHHLAPPAVLATTGIAAAILLEEGLNASSLKAFLVLAVMVIGNPVLTYAAARAQYLRKERSKHE